MKKAYTVRNVPAENVDIFICINMYNQNILKIKCRRLYYMEARYIQNLKQNKVLLYLHS